VNKVILFLLLSPSGSSGAPFSSGNFSSRTQSPREPVNDKTGTGRFVQTRTRSQDQIQNPDPLQEHPFEHVWQTRNPLSNLKPCFVAHLSQLSSRLYGLNCGFHRWH